MATPNADRLHGIEDWRTSAIEDSFRLFSSVKSSLTEIAAINREVASDLGLEGGTANAACKILDGIATGLYEDADNLQKIIDVSKDALAGGNQAKHESQEIQEKLATANKVLENMSGAGSLTPLTPAVKVEVEAKRQALHAEIEKQATKTLSTLNGRTLTAIGGLPFQDQIRAIWARTIPSSLSGWRGIWSPTSKSSRVTRRQGPGRCRRVLPRIGGRVQTSRWALRAATRATSQP